ncbi:hypothetical protein ACT7CS_05130 [Bacillus pacificus]
MDEKREFVTSQRIAIDNKNNEITLLKAEHATFEKEKNNLLSLLSDDGKNTINIFEDVQEFLRHYQYSQVEAGRKIDKLKQCIHDLDKNLAFGNHTITLFLMKLY